MRVLLTGAGGSIGTRLRAMLPAIYPDLRLSDIVMPPDLAPGETFVAADLADMAAVERAVEGVDAIVHLGGISCEAPWDKLIPANIVGCHNLFEAARIHGVKRIVFASSNHAVGFYPRLRRIDGNVPPRPDSRYGVSKAFGEALCALYADKHGIRVTCLRIGNFADLPADERRLAIWLHPQDMVQLVRIGLEHPDIRFEVFYGMSANERAWWDNSRAFAFGYRPRHRAEDHAAYALDNQLKLLFDPVGDVYQGGPFCSDEYDGDVSD